MTTHDDKAREQFEKWAKNCGHNIAKFQNGIYVDDAVQHAWCGFQEGRAISPASTGQEAWAEICERSPGIVFKAGKGLVILEDDLVRIGALLAAPQQVEAEKEDAPDDSLYCPTCGQMDGGTL